MGFKWGIARPLTRRSSISTSKVSEGMAVKVEENMRITITGRCCGRPICSLTSSLLFTLPPPQVRMKVPEGVAVKVEENTRITISGRDKVAVGDFSASVRKWREPEPYKGKGIKYADEVIRRKEGKVGKKK
ncbi:unnamed protein product [Closterium sp. NIES-53]